MIAKPKSWSVVIVGHWNRMIFTPQWVAGTLFLTAEVDVLVGLQPSAPAIFQNQHVTVEVTEKRVDIRTRLANDEALRQVEQVAVRLLAALPNTPVLGAGINFGFVERDADDRLLDLFNVPDGPSIEAAGWAIGERRVMRQLRHGTSTLNLVLLMRDADVDFELNFHGEAATGAAAIAFVQGNVVERYTDAIGLLLAVYGVQLEAEA